MNSRMISFLLMVFFCALTSCSSSYSSPADNMLSAVSKSRVTTIKIQEGPRIECRDATEDEIKMLNNPQLMSGDYCGVKMLEAKDLCPGDEYALYRIDLRNKATLVSNFIAEDCVVSYRILMLMGNDFMKGEPGSFALVHLKTNNVLALSLSPNPIQVSWDDGATISATALEETMLVWYLVGDGFQPNEVLRTTSKSWHEVMESETRASDLGRFIELRLPGVIGKTGGINYVTYERLDTGEKRTLKIPYGSYAFW